MPNVWVVEVTGVTNVPVTYNCTDELSAMTNIITDIYNFINAVCNYTDPFIEHEIKTFHNHVLAGTYNQAINYWHSTTASANVKYSYLANNLFLVPAAPPKLSASIVKHFNTVLLNTATIVGSNGSTYSFIPPTTNKNCQPVISQVPATKGATCRKCKTFNEFTSQAKSDGTYLCYSCKH